MPDRIVQYGTSPMRMGAAGMSGLTTFEDAPIYHQTPTAQIAEFEQRGSNAGNPVAILIGLIIGIALLGMLRANSPAIERVTPAINAWMVLFLFLFIPVSIWAGKIIFGRFQVPGLSPVFAGI